MSIKWSRKDIKDEYDFIICGGGTSGCMLATKLSESMSGSGTSPSILVIEAGPPSTDLANISMVGGLFQAFGTEVDWDLKTVPQEGLNGRVISLNRGKMVGGSSCFNGTLCIRGSKVDYDRWGLPGWSGDEMFEYMRQVETFHPKPWYEFSKSNHGLSGPLHTEPHDLAPISNLVQKSLESFGYPYICDLLTTEESSNACGHAIRTVFEGRRSSSAHFLTEKHKNSVDVLVNTVVDKVEFEKVDGELKASRVILLDKDRNKSNVKAKMEIIISGGSYCSPTILLRSGIGSKDELDEHGIACVIDSPGVGKNLLDHLTCFAAYEVGKEGLTNDYLVHHEGAAAKSLMLYQEKKTGIFSTFPFGIFAFARLDDRLKDDSTWRNAQRKDGQDPMGLTPHQPNVEIFNTEFCTGVPTYQFFPIDKKHAFEMVTILFSPRSSGTVKLKSTNPFDDPVIDHKFLCDPLDVVVLTEGLRLANDVALNGAGTKDVVKGSWPSDKNHHSYVKREDWEEHARKYSATGYHPAGTCKMGLENDKMAVLDENMQVRGVKNLRVVDTSIMPTLNGGHTQMPAYAIGLKAADLIAAKYKSS